MNYEDLLQHAGHTIKCVAYEAGHEYESDLPAVDIECVTCGDTLYKCDAGAKTITDADLATGIVLPRKRVVEAALSWACQQSYSLAKDAILSYCVLRNLEHDCDPMHGYITFKEQS